MATVDGGAMLGDNKKGLFIDERIVEHLEEVLKIARMRDCSFLLPGHQWPVECAADTDAIREATRLWRESWIIGPLADAIERIRGLRVCAVCGHVLEDHESFYRIQQVPGWGWCIGCIAKANMRRDKN